LPCLFWMPDELGWSQKVLLLFSRKEKQLFYYYHSLQITVNRFFPYALFERTTEKIILSRSRSEQDPLVVFDPVFGWALTVEQFAYRSLSEQRVKSETIHAHTVRLTKRPIDWKTQRKRSFQLFVFFSMHSGTLCKIATLNFTFDLLEKIVCISD